VGNIGKKKWAKKCAKMSRNLQKVSGNLQKRACFEQKLTEIYHFLQINILLIWEKWVVL